MNESRDLIENIAIIGFSGRFPGARNIDQFWLNLCKGVESIHQFSDDELKVMGIASEVIKHPNYVKAGTIVEDVDMFDADFFGFSPREAEITDPQQRIFLECAWEALEHAGYSPESYIGLIGVFAGCGPNRYIDGLTRNTNPSSIAEAFQFQIGNEKDYIATRVSYKLNLKGPSLTVQTACSTSLVCVHLACQNLLTYQCDLALAGGVTLNPRRRGGYFYEEGMIHSPDGHCRAFDAKANGIVTGQGAGIVVLKRLSEAVAGRETIHAIIRSTAINNDGSLKVGFTAPSVTGQSEVISLAQALGGVNPENISYVEAHGTGTLLGDPIEIAALTQAFRKTTDKKRFCAIGSVKTNIGHLDTAAGVAGLIKTTLMLKHSEIVPSLNFEKPNPNIDFDNSPFYVVNKSTKWTSEGSPRIAAVSAFGIGGTNAHTIVEEAPETVPSDPSREWQLLLLSAKTKNALDKMTLNLAAHLRNNSNLNLSDVAYTLQRGRSIFNHRRMIVCHNIEEAISSLENPHDVKVATSYLESSNRDIVFMFSGQASEYVNMGLDLYQNELLFRKNIDRCSEIMKPLLSLNLKDILYPATENSEFSAIQFAKQSITQSAIFTIEYALAQLWMEWGIKPSALIGHSIGEYTAACIAGIFTLEDALKLVAVRGKLMERLPPGAMLAVFLPENEVNPYLNEKLSLALINGPSLCVVSGNVKEIEELADKLSKNNINNRRLHTVHAFHSFMTDQILDTFTNKVNEVTLHEALIPLMSNVTGKWMTPEEATDPHRWVRQLRQTVRFADCLEELLTQQGRIFLEVGPGQTLSTLTHQHPKRREGQIALSSIRHPKEKKSDVEFILNTLGQLWIKGIKIDWDKYYSDEKRYRVPLPTYPFERKRYWLDYTDRPIMKPDAKKMTRDTVETSLVQEEALDKKTQESYDVTSRSSVEQILINIWQDILGVSQVKRNDDFFALGGHSLVAVRLFSRIENVFGKRLPLATLLTFPTIEQLADLLMRKDFSPSWASLVKIRSEGIKPPFFCMHSEGGNVLEYHKLANYLDQKMPIYGLQARGLEGDKIVSISVEEMARHYIAEIKMIQPRGPYFIGGYCLGGLVAFEMAKQLEAADEKIGFLALISTSTPDHLKNEILNITAARRFLYRVLERMKLEIDNLSVLQVNEKFLYIGDRIRRVRLTLRVNYENFADYLVRRFHLKPIRHSRRYILEQTRIEQGKAFYDFRPSPIKTKITLFRTNKQPKSLIPDPTLGWTNLSENGILDFEVRAFHKNILKDPNVRSLAEKLQVCLDEAQSASESHVSS